MKRVEQRERQRGKTAKGQVEAFDGMNWAATDLTSLSFCFLFILFLFCFFLWRGRTNGLYTYGECLKFCFLLLNINVCKLGSNTSKLKSKCSYLTNWPLLITKFSSSRLGNLNIYFILNNMQRKTMILVS